MKAQLVCLKWFVLMLQVFAGTTYSIQHSYNPNTTSGSIFETLEDDYPDTVKVDFPAPGGNIEPIDQSALDTWSVVWYIASFGGLILFFLIVSCSEWCCRRSARRRCQRNSITQTVPQVVAETPPPSYDLFAPPAYEDLWGSGSAGAEKRQYDIYVVPVHALGTFMEGVQHNDAPPPYPSPSELPQVHSNRVT